MQQPKVGRTEHDHWILCLLAEDLDSLRAGAFPASNPGCDCEIHWQVTVSQVHKISRQRGLRDAARLSCGIPGCCSSTNNFCKLFSKCLWTAKAQKENHVFHQPSMQIVRFPLVLLTTESRAVSNAAVPASAAQHREEATPCPDLMISFCIKSFPQQQQTWTLNSNRSTELTPNSPEGQHCLAQLTVSDSPTRNMTPVVSCYHERLQCCHREPIRLWILTA